MIKKDRETKSKYKEIVSNLSVTIFANLVSLVGSVVITFLLPKFIGVESFGYYQLYIFYTGYIFNDSVFWIPKNFIRLKNNSKISNKKKKS